MSNLNFMNSLIQGPNAPQLSLVLPPSILRTRVRDNLRAPLTATTIASTFVLDCPQDFLSGRTFSWNDIECLRVTAEVLSLRSNGIAVHAHYFRHTNQIRLGPIIDPYTRQITSRGRVLGCWSRAPTIGPVIIAPRAQPNTTTQRPTRARKPRNSFIIFRQSKHAQVSAENPGLTNGNISKLIAGLWKSAPADVKANFARQAQVEKEAHAAQYPGWKCKPRLSSEIKRRTKKDNTADSTQTNAVTPRDSIEMIGNLYQASVHAPPANLTHIHTGRGVDAMVNHLHGAGGQGGFFDEILPQPDLSWIDNFENELEQIGHETEIHYQEAQSLNEEAYLELSQYLDSIAADNNSIISTDDVSVTSTTDEFGNVWTDNDASGHFYMA